MPGERHQPAAPDVRSSTSHYPAGALPLARAREDLLQVLTEMVAGERARTGHTLVIAWRGQVLALDVRAANVAEIWCLQHRRT